MGVEYASSLDARVFKQLICKLAPQGNDTKSLIRDEKKKLGIPSYGLGLPPMIDLQTTPGWDPETQTFNIKELPKEIKKMFRRVGIKKTNLRNPATAVKIYELLLDKISFSQSSSAQKAIVGGLHGRIDEALN